MMTRLLLAVEPLCSWYQTHQAVAREPRRSCRRASFRPADDHPLVTVAGPAVYRGRPPFGDRRSARGCSGAVPERRVPIRPLPTAGGRLTDTVLRILREKAADASTPG